MARKRNVGPHGLMAAVLRVAGRGRSADATVREITAEAGVTEAALYRHFPSKEALYDAVYDGLVSRMLPAKQAIAAGQLPLRDKLSEWVRVSYAAYDADRAGFTFAVLDPPPGLAELPRYQRQSNLLVTLLEQGQITGELRAMPLPHAIALFVAIMLAIPRGINAGSFLGPAEPLSGAVADTIWRALAATGR